MFRSELCYFIASRMMKTQVDTWSDADSYANWRKEEMLRSWRNFSDQDITGREVLDFGCGEGPLAIHLALTAAPQSVLGVDIDPLAIARAKRALVAQSKTLPVQFEVSNSSALPVADESVDTVLALTAWNM